MNNKAQAIHKIRRNYRINPSEELLEFWEAVSSKKLYEVEIPYHYFTIRLLNIEQVAEFDNKKIKFWIKTRRKHLLVRYYIPLATANDPGAAFFIAAYNEAKHFIGVFLANLRKDPIFLSADLSSLLANRSPELSKEAFIKKEVSQAVRLAFDFSQYFPPQEEGEEEKEYWEISAKEKADFFNEKIAGFLNFVKLVYNAMFPDLKMDLKSLKNSYKVNFIRSENQKNWKEVKREINIPMYDQSKTYFDILLPILNSINFQWWSEDLNKQHEYGFYLIDNGIAMLHVHQLCEFMRMGAIPHNGNAEFPSIIYSTHPSGFERTLEYEIRHFETQEEYSQYYKQFQEDSAKLTVRDIKEADIPVIVNYFLDAQAGQLSLDGYDIMKIPFEEELIEGLQASIKAPGVDNNSFNLILEKGGKAYGHCHIERLTKDGEAYFYFFNWNGILVNKDVIKGLLNKALALIIKAYPLKAIYAETLQHDDYRNNALEAVGFDFVKDHTHVRDAWSRNQEYNLWTLDCENKLKPNK